VRPWLYQRLKNNPAAPSELITSLAAFTQRNLQRNLVLTGELLLILRQLSGSGIKVIPYKGPTLAALAYGDLLEREAGDLDLLIDARDLLAATQVLKARGYVPEMDLSTRQAAQFTAYCNVIAFWQPVQEISVELHWELSPQYLPFPVALPDLQQRLVPSWPGGQQIATIAPEDLLLYLCLHGAKHAWERLSWVLDIARLLERQPHIDWDKVNQQTRTSNYERVLLQGLWLAQRLAGAELPLEIRQRIATDPVLVSLSAQVETWMAARLEREPAPLARVWHLLRLQTGWRKRSQFLRRLVISPSAADWQMWQLPEFLNALYFVLRPLRLGGVWLRKLVTGSAPS
jgi:hypothetical protein